MSSVVRILLVDDEQLVREAISCLLTLQPGMSVVGEAENARTAVCKARALKPDIVLLDVNLPDHSGVEVISILLQDDPRLLIILLTAFADEEQVLTAFRAGAVGCVLKTQAIDDLVRAIESAQNGLARVSPCVASMMLKALNPSAVKLVARKIQLSDIEMKVVVDIACGFQNKEIARHLHMSSGAVRSHINHILAKLDLESRTQIAIYAAKQGWAGFHLSSRQQRHSVNR